MAPVGDIPDLFSADPGRSPETDPVTVEVAGTTHTVPAGITVLQALWHAGQNPIHGVGCLGGACGSCTTTYRMGDNPTPKTGLGCQITVADGMSISLYPIDPPPYRVHDVAAMDDPASGLFEVYPESRRCTRCDACTTVCPQDIPVRATVVQILNGDFDPVARAFDECVMCGFCTLVCEVGIAPNRLGMFARRVVSSRSSTPELARAVAQTDANPEEWHALLDPAGGSWQDRCAVARGASHH